MKSEKERMGRRYIGAVAEWRDSCEFPLLSLTTTVVSFLRSYTTCTDDES